MTPTEPSQSGSRSPSTKCSVVELDAFDAKNFITGRVARATGASGKNTAIRSIVSATVAVLDFQLAGVVSDCFERSLGERGDVEREGERRT